jgi:hypothetical protein
MPCSAPSTRRPTSATSSTTWSGAIGARRLRRRRSRRSSTWTRSGRAPSHSRSARQVRGRPTLRSRWRWPRSRSGRSAASS